MNPADTETALGLIRLCQQSGRPFRGHHFSGRSRMDLHLHCSRNVDKSVLECVLNASCVNLDLNAEVESGVTHINIKSEQVLMHNELKVTFQSRLKWICTAATSQNDKCLVRGAAGVNMHTAQLAHVSDSPLH